LAEILNSVLSLSRYHSATGKTDTTPLTPISKSILLFILFVLNLRLQLR